MANTSEKIAENILLLAISRVSMALALPLIGFISWLGSQYLESKFEIVNDRVAVVERKADDATTQAAKTNDRLISVETKQSQDALAAAKFQDATLVRLDRVQDSLVGLSNTVAALTATLQAVTEERKREFSSPR